MSGHGVGGRVDDSNAVVVERSDIHFLIVDDQGVARRSDVGDVAFDEVGIGVDSVDHVGAVDANPSGFAIDAHRLSGVAQFHSVGGFEDVVVDCFSFGVVVGKRAVASHIVTVGNYEKAVDRCRGVG